MMRVKMLDFFYIIGHGIPDEFISGVHAKAREFFDLPAAQKKQITIQPGKVRGYQVLGENITKQKRDWHEAIDYYVELKPDQLSKTAPIEQNEIIENPDVNSNRRLVLDNLLRGKNPWPEAPSGFRSLFEEYTQHQIRLGSAIMSAIALGLGHPENYFEEKGLIDNSFWVMRIIGYPPLQGATQEDVGISCGEHTDYGCLTMVNQDSTKDALQILTKEGEWISANPIPGAFVMNIGDMMTVWTGGEFKSTLHRVVHRGTGFRTSIPFFYEPNFEALVKPFTGVKEAFTDMVYGKHLLNKTSSNFKYDDDPKQN
eukprot:TRINITY_DN3887_c0_g1_i3.p1 TRINITY_DN3887_c0_g1~~TRINITY_DN3887_c0_g1_i3.p1  ORF type:complete len:313 (+),score=64.76 TRINITY_DN3887_c0_g1_i3:192-1130(+)